MKYDTTEVFLVKWYKQWLYAPCSNLIFWCDIMTLLGCTSTEMSNTTNVDVCIPQNPPSSGSFSASDSTLLSPVSTDGLYGQLFTKCQQCSDAVYWIRKTMHCWSIVAGQRGCTAWGLLSFTACSFKQDLKYRTLAATSTTYCACAACCISIEFKHCFQEIPLPHLSTESHFISQLLHHAAIMLTSNCRLFWIVRIPTFTNEFNKTS